MRIECESPLAVVQEAFWLAWQACGGPQGMGIFQNRPGATKEEVWNAVYNKTDYPGANKFNENCPGNVYGDYVFGRMMKVGFEWDDKTISCHDGATRLDYQSWCGKYKTYQALVEAAVANVSSKE